jgi:hypothetical protein
MLRITMYCVEKCNKEAITRQRFKFGHVVKDGAEHNQQQTQATTSHIQQDCMMFMHI